MMAFITNSCSLEPKSMPDIPSNIKAVVIDDTLHTAFFFNPNQHGMFENRKRTDREGKRRERGGREKGKKDTKRRRKTTREQKRGGKVEGSNFLSKGIFFI
jgi:hypothetical protein